MLSVIERALYGFRAVLKCAGKVARSNRTPAMGNTDKFAGNLGVWSIRAAETALSPGHNAFAGNGGVAQSKAAAGGCPLANPAVTSGTAEAERITFPLLSFSYEFIEVGGSQCVVWSIQGPSTP